MTSRFMGIPFLLAFLFAVGCVRHTTVQDFGLPGGGTPKHAVSTPDSSLRAIFQKQTKGAFNPLSEDVRIQNLRKRLTMNPADVDARLELAAAYEGYRLYSEALEQFTEAFGLSRSEKAVLGIARSDQALNRTWQAIPLLEQFVKESPSPALWNTLGLLHASDNLAAGENALHEAIAADPKSDQWHNNLAYNLMLQNKTDAAESEFQKALELNSKSVATHNNLGILLARRGNLQAALEQFQFGADAATAHNNLAVVLMELGKYDQSREELVKALAIRRNFAPALSNFKLVQDRMRQREQIQRAERLPRSNIRVASAEQEESQLKDAEDR
jgi:tetratricopeptide (TPR) repeat protein